MPAISRLFDYLSGKLARGSEVRGEFDQIINLLDGGLDNDNIANGANISLSKIAGMTTLSGHVGTLSGRVTTLSGTTIPALSAAFTVHAHNGTDTPKVDHSNLSNVTANQHHVEFVGLSAGGTSVLANTTTKRVEIKAGGGLAVKADGNSIIVSGAMRQRLFTSSGSFTVGSDCNLLFITMAGAGGGGGAGYGASSAVPYAGGGGGGAGGFYSRVGIKVPPGTILYADVGLAGVGGTAPSGNGTNGQPSVVRRIDADPIESPRVDSFVASGGGKGFGGDSGVAGISGIGGGSHSIVNLGGPAFNQLSGAASGFRGSPIGNIGGNGGGGFQYSGGIDYWAGGGGATQYGIGGQAGTPVGALGHPSGHDGVGYGSGGGGGVLNTGNGGNGAKGMILFEWFS